MFLLLLVLCVFASFVSAQSASVEFLDEWGEATSRVLEKSRVLLRVIDPAADTTAGRDSVSVDLSAVNGQDTATAHLVESDGETGVFEGEAVLTTDYGLDNYEGADADQLYTRWYYAPGITLDTATATYGSASDSVEVGLSEVRLMDGEGRGTATLTLGEPVRVRVRDAYADLSAGPDRTTATVTASGGGSQVVTLIETGAHTRTFAGSVDIPAAVGETVTATHLDLATAASTSSATATVVRASVSFIRPRDGRTTDLLLANSAFPVRVTDASRNHDPAVVENLSVLVSLVLVGDYETITLHETGPDTGVFEGAIRHILGGVYPTPGNGSLDSSADLTQLDSVRAQYELTIAEAPMTVSITRLVDEDGADSESVALGSDLRAEVETAVDYTSPYIDVRSVEVRSLTTGDVEMFGALETDGRSYLFKGSIPIVPGTAVAGDRLLQAQPGEAIEVVHDVYGTASSDRATVVRSAVRFVDAGGLPVSVLVEESTARVRVLDPLSAGQAPPAATIRSRITDDVEPLSLAELPGSPGVFSGSIPMKLWNWSSGILGTGREYVVTMEPDAITASAGQDAASLLMVPAILEIVDGQGETRTTAAAGEALTVRAIAPRANTASYPESFVVIATSVLGADWQYVPLTETGGSTGIFEGALPVLNVEPADMIEVVYNASNYPNDPTGRVSTVVAIVPTAVQLLDDQGEAASSYVFGDDIHIRVAEPAANANPAAAEALTVKVFSHRYGDARSDAETVSLTETGPDTGVFTGALPTGVLLSYFALPVPGDGLLQFGDFVQEPDSDSKVTATRNGASATARIRDSELWLTDEQGQDADSFTVGSTIRIWMRRPAGNTTPGIESVLVTADGIRVADNLDTEYLTLTETGGNTGLFTGTLPTGPPPQPYGIMQAEPGDILIVRRSYYHLYSFDTAVFTGAVVEPPNQEPDAVDDSASTNEDTSVVIAVGANDTDPDGDTIEVFGVWLATNGTVYLSGGGTVTYIPYSGFAGTDSFMYVIRDRSEGSSYLTDTATVTVTVNPVNDPPFAVNDSATTNEDTPVNVAVKANDVDLDGDPLTVTSATPGTNGSTAIQGNGTITYTPNLNFHGTDTFTYTASDGNGGTDTATVTITVSGVNDPPVAVNDLVTTNEDTIVVAPVLANDSDPDGALTITAVTQGTKGVTAIQSGGTVRYTPNANANGADSFTYTVSDGSGGTATATVAVTIIPVNDTPDAVNDSATANEDTALNFAVAANDTDVDGDALIVTAVTQGAKGSVAINQSPSLEGKYVIYTPNANANGSDSFTYTISDGHGGTATGSVAMTITPVNDPPLAGPDTAVTNENTPVTVSVLANDADIDGGALSVSAVTQGFHGAVTTNGATVTYTPATGFSGSDSFTYNVSDGVGGVATGLVTVTVNDVNGAPVAAPDSGSTREGVAVIIAVLANDTDPDGNSLTVTAVGSPGVLLPDNTVRYTPGANFTGTVTFSYTVSDGQGGTANGQVTVVVGEALERVAVLATNSVALRTGSDVLSGDVIVNQAGAGPFLNGAELSIAGSVTTPANWDVEADSLTVTAGAVIGSDVSYNQLTNGGTINGLQRSPLALPVFPTLPAFLTATPGSTTINVATNGTRTLAPGSYLDLVVGKKGTVTFTGGTYHFRSITVDREAKLLFSASSQVRVQQKLSTKTLTTVGPATGAAIASSSILFYVAGINGTTGALTATPKAVEIGTSNTVAINLYAPNGMIWLQDGSLATGAFLGKDIDVGLNTQVALDSAF
jgi:hypothetical protein